MTRRPFGKSLPDRPRHLARAPGQVAAVGRNHQAAAGDLAQDELGLHILAACDPLHLGSEDALPGRFELREIRRHFGLPSAGTNRIKLTGSAE